MRSDLVGLEVAIHHETSAAYLVSLDGERSRAVWVPKSACEFEAKNQVEGTLTLTERLAIEKGLV